MTSHSPEQWRRICDHLETAFALATDARAAFLDRLARLEPDLSLEVGSLLAAHERLEAKFLRPATRLADADADPLGSGEPSVGAYRLLRELGHGGMGTVYLAERADDAHRKRVALKLLQAGVEAPDLVERFERERRILAKLDHPGIARLLDGGTTTDGRPYLVMEWIEGERGDVYYSRAALPLPSRLGLFHRVCLAVHHAHQRGIVHGDLKPANVIVTPQGDPKLLDFGIARLLGPIAGSGDRWAGEPRHDGAGDVADERLATPAFTPAYASPEQLLCRPLTTASDVFSLGIVLFELMTGARPFPPLEIGSLDPADLAAAVEGRRPPRLADVAQAAARSDHPAPPAELLATDGLPDLERVLARALAASPADRYPSAGELARDVALLLAGDPVSDAPRPWRGAVRRWVRRRRSLVGAAAATLATVSALAVVLVVQGLRGERRSALALRFGQQAQQILSIAREAPLLPPELARRQAERLRLKVEAVRAEAAAVGSDAEGPAGYPLGVGSYALGDYAGAQDHLERAWRDGFRTPLIALALGETLGARYSQSLRQAARIAPPELRREARRRAASAFRDPAMGYLRVAGVEDPRLAGFLEASLAFLDGRLDEAAAKARAAFELVPWLYEAKRLEGDCYLEKAARARDRDDVATAFAWYEKAGEAYARALEVARGETGLHAAECSRRASLAELARGPLETQTSFLEDALRACEHVLALDPRLADVRVETSRVYLRRGLIRAQAGLSPDADLSASERLAAAALAIDPESSTAHLQLGTVLRELAVRREDQGLDVTETLRRAERAHRRAAELDPGSAVVLNGLGALSWYRAHQARRAGADARPHFQTAIAAYRRALELVPDYSRAHNNIGACQLEDAIFRGARGEDVQAAFGAAAASFRRAIALGPGVALYHSNLANSELELAFHRYRRTGEDPEPRIALAVASYRDAIRIDPSHHRPWHNLALAEKVRGRVLLDRDKDPREVFGRALGALAQSERLSPGTAGVYLERASIHLLAARWSAEHGDGPRASVGQAEAAIRKALALAPASPQALFSQAELLWWQARWAPRGDLRRGLIARGRATAARVLDVNPEDAPALALIAGFDLLSASSGPAGAQRRSLAAAATSSLERALALDPYLDAELQALLPWARTLAEPSR